MEKTFTLKCPKCRLSAQAELESPFHKFLIYTCPRCRSNVVYYGDRVDTISNRLLNKLIKRGRVCFCGNISFKKEPKIKIKLSSVNTEDIQKQITKDDLLNLHILLETEKDFDRILSQL